MTHRYYDHAVISVPVTTRCYSSPRNISRGALCDLCSHAPAASPENERECECVVRQRNCRYHILVVVIRLLFCIVSIGVYVFCNIARRTRTDGGHGRTRRSVVLSRKSIRVLIANSAASVVCFFCVFEIHARKGRGAGGAQVGASALNNGVSLRIFQYKLII